MVDLAVLGLRLESMVLRVFSNLNDAMILCSLRLGPQVPTTWTRETSQRKGLQGMLPLSDIPSPLLPPEGFGQEAHRMYGSAHAEVAETWHPCQSWHTCSKAKESF